MKKIFLLYLLSIAALFLLDGCAFQTANTNIENSKKLRVNMTKAQVLKIMGEPIKGEEYVSENVWYYYTSMRWFDARTTEDECLPLVFKNGKLAGWGWDYYEKSRIQHKHGK